MKILVFLELLLFTQIYGQYYSYRRSYYNTQSYTLSGPNVCSVQRVGSKKIYTESRTVRYTSQDICGQRPYKEYDCCIGYEKIPGYPGCSKATPLKDLMETLADVGATEFLNAARYSGVQYTLSRTGPYTLFAPVNEVFNKTSKDLRRRLRTSQGFQYHVVKNGVELKDFDDELELETLAIPGKVVVNNKETGITTVNCARITRPNIPATNGIIHLIDKILDRYPETITNIIYQDKRLQTLQDLIARTRLTDPLMRNGPFTVFAPTVDAFKKIPSEVLTNILANTEALTKILQHHVVKGTICSNFITRKQTLKTLAGSKLEADCDRSGVTLNKLKARIVEPDIIASNGVVHMIDTVLMPVEAKTLLDRAEELGLKTFVKLLKQAGLDKDLALYSSGPYTLFAPSDYAFSAMRRDRSAKVNSDKDFLRNVLNFHIGFGKIMSNQLVDDTTVDTKLYPRKLRINVYRAILGYKEYDCCIGYEKIPGYPGCSKATPLKDLMETLADVGATEFLNAARYSGVQYTLSRTGPYTLFAPVNEVFNKTSKDLRRRLRTSQGFQYHVVKNGVELKDFDDELELETLAIPGKVVVNNKETGITTVNCARITRPNIPATNGIIHLIDKILDRYPETITNIIYQDKRLQTLQDLIARTRLTDPLMRNGPFTVFAPTVDAFKKIPSEVLTNILANTEALTKILQHHVVKGTICSNFITRKQTLKTLAGSKLEADCDRSGVTLNKLKARIVEPDIIASNGVVHMIDTVLMPVEAKTLLDRAEELGLKTFVKLLKEAGLDKDLALYSSGPYTLFAPSDYAFSAMRRDRSAKVNSDKDFLRNVLNFHIGFGKIMSNQLVDDTTVDTKLYPRKLRINVYRAQPSIEASSIEKGDFEAANGVIHIIDRVIFPPEQTLDEIMTEDECLRPFEEALKKEGLAAQLSQSGSYTVFVPTRAAVRRVKRRLDNMSHDQLKKILKNHILEGVYTSCAFQEGTILPLKNQNGKELSCSKSRGRMLLSRRARVSRTNIMATNGVLHVVDEVLEH
ncbi:transforming growth factor-beta-induced protein ig-h3 [Lingula anatina]|uniref:Transforming growth factor-beta-induced protein ig-h3 n=1 Tax=Lingula anatina TaxID=7574 RepID=A0A1S3JTU9_LINAN|nr:transforming growth factor-beta-induced protein ig-h3 [Lingula anatina]|eukprot:XP_013413795.1 transforming growth factor-beta-induced protein ig-h3 [Lingula anatina]